MSEPTGISSTTSVKRYLINSEKQTHNSTNYRGNGGLLKSPPVVIPQEMPRQTMCRIFKCREGDLDNHLDYTMMRDALLAYQRSGEGKRWDDFRNKVPAPLLARWGTVVIECQRNGFIAPDATPDAIRWQQITAAHGDSTDDLCTLCERPCRRREFVESGGTKWDRTKEPKQCWRIS